MTTSFRFRKLFDYFYLPLFLLLQWVVVKYRLKSVHTSPGERSVPPHRAGRASAVDASRQLSLWRQKAVPPHRGRGGRSLRPISNYHRQLRQQSLCVTASAWHLERALRVAVVFNLPGLWPLFGPWPRRDASPAARVLSTGAAVKVKACSLP